MFSQYTHTTRRGVQMTRRSIVFLFCSTLALLTIASAPAQELSTAPRANLKFGHTFVGKTQYIDAFQRGNFWQFVAGTNYHTLVSPHTLAQVSLNLAANDALAIPPSLFGSCGPLGIVNINTLIPILVNQ